MKLITRASTAVSAMAKAWKAFTPAGGGTLPGEQGDRLPSDAALQRLMQQMWIDTDRRAMIQQIRSMDATDGRVKRIHSKLAMDTIRGGLVLQVRTGGSNEVLKREWEGFKGRLQLDNAEKLKSDCRGFVMEGNLPLQLVTNEQLDVVAGIRMPSETIVPMTDMGGRFSDPTAAYEQRDVMTGKVIGSWPAWKLVMARLDPDNYDDMGSMGRPFLDACATTWQKLVMTEEDLVIRRRMRAPLRLAHILEGADQPALDAYRKQVENEKGEITTDFYLNRKGGVTSIQGDSNMGEMADVAHLLDTFYSGSPAPKGLFGYTEGLSRDILEDLKRGYFEEVDSVQDALAGGYNIAFRVHLLLKGMDPTTDEFTLRYATRRTETPNQIADLALKYIALGLPSDMVWADMGLDPDFVRAKQEEQAKRTDPYPAGGAGVGPDGKPAPKISVTPGNQPKGESATSIGIPGSNGGRGRA